MFKKSAWADKATTGSPPSEWDLLTGVIWESDNDTITANIPWIDGATHFGIEVEGAPDVVVETWGPYTTANAANVTNLTGSLHIVSKNGLPSGTMFRVRAVVADHDWTQ